MTPPKKKDFKILFNMYGCFPCMYVCVPCAWLMPKEPEKAVRTRVTNDCEPLYGCWEMDPRSSGRAGTAVNLNPLSSVFCFCFGDRVSQCSPGYPGTHSVDQAGLRFIEICLSLPPEY